MKAQQRRIYRRGLSRIELRVPHEVAETLKRYAELHKISLNQLVNNVLGKHYAEFLEQNKCQK